MITNIHENNVVNKTETSIGQIKMKNERFCAGCCRQIVKIYGLFHEYFLQALCTGDCETLLQFTFISLNVFLCT